MSTKRQKITPNPAITQVRISTRSARDAERRAAERRAAVANREITRWDVAYDHRPHTPALAREWTEREAMTAAQRVVEGCAEIRASQNPAPSMDEVVESIKLKPRPATPHFVTPDVILLAQLLPVALGLLAAFFAGLALGRAL